MCNEEELAQKLNKTTGNFTESRMADLVELLEPHLLDGVQGLLRDGVFFSVCHTCKFPLVNMRFAVENTHPLVDELMFHSEPVILKLRSPNKFKIICTTTDDDDLTCEPRKNL